MKRYLLSLAAVIPAFVLAMSLSTAESAEESLFRKNFIKSYRNDNFTALEFLIKSNKKGVPGEIKGLIEEAKAKENFQEKMDLLDIASTMATMYNEWHKDGAPLAEVEAIQRAEIKKEQERKAEQEKWNEYEKVLGNFLMRTNMKDMEAKKVSPVLYPHWLHRFVYDCKACHQGVFTMKRGANALNHASMDEGKSCGTCHDGKTSFSTKAKEDCDRCHNIGKPGEERIKTYKKADLKSIKESAARLGAEFSPEKLPKGSIIFDKFGMIDWGAMKKAGAWTPVKSLKKDAKDEVRDNTILYESPIPYIKNVVFDHKYHSESMECAACHQDVYKDQLGANNIPMSEMANGKGCGACHGKVSFKLADCQKCHARPQSEGVPSGTLQRVKK